MHRRVVAGFLVLCALFAASAGAKTVQRARVTIAPGVSMVFTAGWEACVTGGLQRNSQAFAVFPHGACSQPNNNSLYLRYNGNGQPIDYYITHVDDPAVKGVNLKDAPPEYSKALTDDLCAKARQDPAYDFGACQWFVGSIAGRAALVWTGTIVAKGDPLKLKYEILAFSIPDQTGYVVAMAMTPVMVRGKTEPIIRAIQDSLVVEGVSETAASDGSVTLTPMSGLSLDVPKGWAACDAATNARLGDAGDPENLRPLICTQIGSGFDELLGIFNPRPLHEASLHFIYNRNIPVSDDKIATLERAPRDPVTQDACANVLRPMQQQNVTIESCTVSFTTLAGHPAMVVEVISSQNWTSLTRFKLREYELALGGGDLEIQVSTPVSLESAVAPDVNAILGSLKLASPASPGGDAAKPGSSI
jgi:hypothetical protein